jgi:hypothetical protein
MLDRFVLQERTGAISIANPKVGFNQMARYGKICLAGFDCGSVIFGLRVFARGRSVKE